MEYDVGKPKPNIYKILKHFNQDIWESGNVSADLILTYLHLIITPYGITWTMEHKTGTVQQRWLWRMWN